MSKFISIIADLLYGHEFDMESSRCMLSMMDENRSGVLELPEVLK